MLKIKVKPEDFIVEEIADIPFQKNGNYVVCLLKKEGWNTVDAIKRLSKRLNVPFSNFSYGGKKDKHALTSQYITVTQHAHNQHPFTSYRKDKVISPTNSPRFLFTPGGLEEGKREKATEICEEHYSLHPVGLMDRPMGPDLIKGNRFTITIRNLIEDDIKPALHEIDKVRNDGYPNYFDDQRFGSFDPRQGFLAERILKKHYNGALKIYFTHIRPEDSKEEKDHKRFLFENWGNWQVCLEQAKSRFEKEAFGYLKKNPKDFTMILQKIPHEEMSLFFSAYQSYLWNELLRRIVKSISKDTLKVYRGTAGDYLFYQRLDDEHKEYLEKLDIPTPASNIRMSDALTEILYSEILKDHAVRPPMFNIRKIRQTFFRGSERRSIIIPGELLVDSSEDEIYQNKRKLILKFFLPRGCYGTMLIKRLFSQAQDGQYHEEPNRVI